jgi:hypothetical protein
MDALGTAGQELREVLLAQEERQLPIVVAFARQHVEGVELDLVIVFAGLQGIEVGYPVHAQDDSLAVEHEPILAQFQRGLDDPRKALRPIQAVLAPDAHDLALPDHHHPVAIVFDFMKPVGTRRNLGRLDRLEGLVSKHRERAYRGGRCAHWVKIKNPAHPGYSRVQDAHGRRAEKILEKA